MKNVLSRVLSIVLLSLAVAPLSGGALAQGSGALGVRDDSNPAYWSDRWRGWHFYEDPPQEEVEPPSRPAPSTAPRPTASPRPPELVEFERLQKTLEDLRNIAIMRPSEANVRRYMELEMQVVNRASYFADVAQRVAWATPDLDPTVQGRPVNAKALEVFERQSAAPTAQPRSPTLAARPRPVLRVPHRTAPTARPSRPVLQAFEARHGLQVTAVSIDGGPMPGFPRARPDNGIATALRVTQVPATFLAQPRTGMITPIGFGVLSESQLLERIAIVSSPQAEASLPGATQRLALP
jgi:conjugal transfer pilus assembly protein TraF